MMYKTGSDTCAITALLIHGASVHGSDGAPNIELPAWANEESKADLVKDLRMIAQPAVSRRNLSKAEIDLLRPRFHLQILGAEVSGPSPERTAAPNAQSFGWDDVSFRLTLVESARSWNF